MTSMRTVARARARMTRQGRRGRRAVALVAAYEAQVLVDRVISARLKAAATFRLRGTMPHVSSGRHQEKLRKRREARLIDSSV